MSINISHDQRTRWLKLILDAKTALEFIALGDEVAGVGYQLHAAECMAESLRAGREANQLRLEEAVAEAVVVEPVAEPVVPTEANVKKKQGPRAYQPRVGGKRGPAHDKRGNRKRGRRPPIEETLACKIKWVAQRRLELGLSTREVAEHYNVSTSTVRKLGAKVGQDGRRRGLVAVEPVGDERWWSK